eukprot:GEMP01000805.1.p1 GENE.GEMP01000805.1~~GEMP01000805.1.p1  ORF type:complete len:1988 (+),score=560.46 GEMP01000805.1:41-6004(+)
MEDPAEGDDEDAEREEVPDEPQIEEEPLLGSMGGLLRNSFSDFFGEIPVDTVNGALNFAEEDNVIAKAQKQLDADTKRLAELRSYLNVQTDKAKDDDKDIAEYLQSQGLTIKENFPVGESMLQLDTEVVQAENLLVPRELMAEFERNTRIQQGVEQKHPNRFAYAKPEQPNYLKLTPALVIRQAARGIVPRLNDDQRSALKKLAKPRRKKQVAFLSNPRIQAERGTAGKGQPCPFRVTPSPVIFQNYEIGGIYEIVVEVLNWTANGRRVRVKPLNSSILSYELKYRGPPVVAPGMATHVHVRFMPLDLNDVRVALTLQTAAGDFDFPVMAIRDPPKLESEKTIHCGCVLAGGYNTTHTASFANRGGEAAFRISPSENDDDYHYQEAADGTCTLTLGPFHISPVSFYLMRDEEVNVTVEFVGAEEDIGEVSRELAIECDSGEVTHVTVSGICDGLRCELLEWKRTPLAPPEVAPEFWTMVQPWRLFWRSQVREERVEDIVIGNGSHLPLTLRWVFARPPDCVLRDLATGTLPFLSTEILDTITQWEETSDSFAVTPRTIRVDPFSSHSFAFAFRARPPIGRKCTVFALLYAVDLPTKDTIENAGEKQSLRRALVPFPEALRLQKELKPTDGSGAPPYACGMPLSANRLVDLRASSAAVHTNEGEAPLTSSSPSCLLSTLCLQGTTLAPHICVTPPIVTFPGTILPYVPQCTTVSITNASNEFPTTFTVRTLRTDNWANCDMFKPIMVVSEADVGKGPSMDNLLPPLIDVGKKDDVTRRDRWGEYLDDKMIWPPLPPAFCCDSPHPGHGALATVVLRPSTGTLEPGQTLALELIFRCKQATDIDALIQVDLDDACAPVDIRLCAAVRAPMVEVQDAALLDYGIVRAHASHILGFTLRNPSNVPCLAYVDYAKDRQEMSRVPGFTSYSTICDHYLEGRSESKESPPIADVSLVDNSDLAAVTATATVSSDTRRQSIDTRRHSADTRKSEEDGVASWICALCGCRDTSGRPGPLQRDIVDQIFDIAPWFVVPPQGTKRVKVKFRARHVERFRAFLDIHVFDSPETFAIEVLAEVQLPVVTISRGHLIYPMTYLKRPTPALTFEMCNESDMEARFDWKHQEFTQTCLEVQLNPTSGCVPPRGALKVSAVVVAMSSNAEGIGRAEMKAHVDGRILSIPLLVTAHIFAVEVDGAIVAPGQVEPIVASIPRALDTSQPLGVFRFDSESDVPTLDLGSIEVQTTTTMKILMYNRSGIETPFSVSMLKYPHFDRLTKGRKVSQAVLAIANMQSTIAGEESVSVGPLTHENRPAARYDDGQVRKKFLLSDFHESHAFRGKNGADLAASKRAAATGSTALNYGYGWALKLYPSAGWIAAYGTACVECTAYSDLPGLMEDMIRVEIRELPTVHVPARFESTGSPLYLPPLQVALNTDVTPAILDCGSLVIAEKQVTRRFKVANSSESGIVVKWRAYPADAIDNLDRPLLQFGLRADGTFGATAIAPTAVDPLAPDGCCPVSVDPPSGILARKNDTSFTVTLTAKLPGIYRYKLIGLAYLQHKGRTAEDDDRDGSKFENSKRSRSDAKQKTADGSQHQQMEVSAVRQLPPIPCVDSDEEEPSISFGTTAELAPPTPKEEEWPLSTTVIDVRGECIIPKLTIDKRIHETYGMPVVKYYKTSVPDPDIRRVPDPRFPGVAPGPVVVGGGMSDPARGIVAARMRSILFVNNYRCPLYTRLRVDSGPFKICRVEQVTEWPQKKAADGVFTKVLEWKQQMEVWVEFEAPHWSKWEGHEQTYTGELVVEYPHDQSDVASIVQEESQKVKLVAVCRKPKLTIDLVTIAEPYSVPPPINENVVVVEFFRVHVQALIEVKRRIVLRNETNVLAHWKVFHVERKVGRRASESDSLDHGDVFAFGQSEGTLYGPSLPYRCLPLGPALEHYLPHDDTDEYRPLFIQVAFHPKKDAEYMSRFRFQVQGGASVDIICHGHGSYREEDDIMELVEA